MRLAEALILRADLKQRIGSLIKRLGENVLVQEGSRPAEEPALLLQALRNTLAEQEELVRRINLTNASATLDNGMTITAAIARRDHLTQLHSALRNTATAAVPKQAAYTKSELRVRATVDVQELQSEADSAAKAAREIDALIQEYNWRAELLP